MQSKGNHLEFLSIKGRDDDFIICFRWDIKALEELQEYMRACFLALFNTVNGMAYDVLRDQGFNIIPHSTQRVQLCFFAC